MNKALFSTESHSWRTPKNLLDLVREIDAIGLDPATDADNPAGALMKYAPPLDGLSVPWGGHGLCYVNPPYGRALPAWTAKMALAGSAGVEVVALLPARTDTRWWQHSVVTAHAICFWKGRLTFVGAPAPAPFPSAVAYWGPRRGRFCDVFSRHGWVTSAAYQTQIPGTK